MVSPLKNSSQQITAMDLVQELKAEGVAAAATAATLGQEKRALADMFENEDLSSLVKQEEAQEALEDRMDVTGDNPPPPPPSAAATATSTPASANPGLNAATVAASGASAVEGADFNELLKVFYARLFPFKLFHKWLAYGSSKVDRPFPTYI